MGQIAGFDIRKLRVLRALGWGEDWTRFFGVLVATLVMFLLGFYFPGVEPEWILVAGVASFLLIMFLVSVVNLVCRMILEIRQMSFVEIRNLCLSLCAIALFFLGVLYFRDLTMGITMGAIVIFDIVLIFALGIIPFCNWLVVEKIFYPLQARFHRVFRS